MGDTDSDMGGNERLAILLNGSEHTIPNGVETVADLLRAVDLDPAGYELYRDENVETLGPDQRCRDGDDPHGLTAVDMSDSDEFVAIPRVVQNG